MTNDKDDQEDLIRQRAFLLWELEGRPEGREEEYWHRARELIESEALSTYPPSDT